MSSRIAFRAQRPEAANRPKEYNFLDKSTAIPKPTAVFTNVNYKTKGKTTDLPENYRKVVAYVEKTFSIPQDFEVSSTFGVHSGSCYERRLIAAYVWGQLTPKDGCTAKKMCVECGEFGHFRDDCEELLKQ